MNTRFISIQEEPQLKNTWDQSVRAVKDKIEDIATEISSLGIGRVTSAVIGRRYHNVSIRTYLDDIKKQLDKVVYMLENLDEDEPMKEKDKENQKKATKEHIERGRKLKNS